MVDTSKPHLYLWPESSRLKTAINEKRTGTSYTLPGIKDDEIRKVDVDNKTQACYDSHFGLLDIQKNLAGFTKLLVKLLNENVQTRGHFQLCLNATTKLLTDMGFGFGKTGKSPMISFHALQLFHIRFQLLSCLNMTATLIDEILAFDEMDAPDLYFQYHSESEISSGSIVPFAMRILHAEVLRLTPYPWKSIERFRKLEANVNQTIADLEAQDTPEEHLNDWRARLVAVQSTKARTLFALEVRIHALASFKEYQLAMQTCDNIKTLSNDITIKGRVSRDMTRMAIAVGDEKAVLACLEEAAVQPNASLTLLKAFRSVFLGSFSHSLDYVNRLATAGCDSATMHNTSAISLLYTGRVKEAVKCFNEFNKFLPVVMKNNLKAMAELGLSSSEKQLATKEAASRKIT